MKTIKAVFPGDIVQLDPQKTKNPHFQGHLLVVTEVKSWGVQGYVNTFEGQAYYRAEFGTFEPTGGGAVWMTKLASDTGDEKQPSTDTKT